MHSPKHSAQKAIGVVTPTIKHDLKIAVPASPRLLTTFVLHEQHDWFEDEIRFIRRFIRPGMMAVDIGANYGVYALTIAALSGADGAQGHVWAFEPTTATFGYLRQSVAENHLDNITLIQAGLSDRIGEAQFFTSPNAELNSLSAIGGGEQETIRLLTLDHCSKEFGWSRLDFIKLDAEGEEIKILHAARETLSALSPLIMFELKHGSTVNLALLQSFASLGYEPYRLIPALNALAPFDVQAPFDGYLLNLFCCKRETAESLAEKGLLTKAPQFASADKTRIARGQLASRVPTSAMPTSVRQESELPPANTTYRAILDDYLLTWSDELTLSERLGHLLRALQGSRDLLTAGEHRPECLTTLARIAFDAGERTLGVKLLTDVLAILKSRRDTAVREPWLPASSRYDAIPADGSDAWFEASVLEQYIDKHAFSTYFSGKACLPLFERLEQLGHLSESMRRRYYLAKSLVT